MDYLNKDENMSSIYNQKDHLQVQMEEIVKDTLGIVDNMGHRYGSMTNVFTSLIIADK
jgi:hypothetical protein